MREVEGRGMIMSESDKEFEEYWARYYCFDNPNLSDNHPKGDCKYLWDYLYPYKKKCEELESSISKPRAFLINKHHEAFQRAVNAESLLIEAHKCIIDLLGDAPLNKLKCHNFLNKPEIKSLMEQSEEKHA